MDMLFSAIVLRLFWLDGETTYDRLCMEDHLNERTYRIYNAIFGETLKSQQEFDRVLRACQERRDWEAFVFD